MAKGIYIAGAGKDAGKTTLSLGLLNSFIEKLPDGVAFIKPLGQKTTLVQGDQVGQDSWFVDSALGMGLPLDKSAPFSASSGAAATYIRTGKPAGLPGRVLRAYRSLGRKGRLVLVEGTGHPGVGSVFDMSNARVAKILGTPVLLVLDGGIGSTIDRFNLCASMFRHYDVQLIGVVINRIIPGKMDQVRELLGKWFGERNIPVFGYIPYEDSLARPSLGLIRRAIGAEPMVVEGAEEVASAGYISAFGSTEEVIRDVSRYPERTVLAAHSRPEVLDALLVASLSGGKGPGAVIVCGGEPDSRRREAFRAAGIPLYATARGMEVSSDSLSRKIFKVEPHEQEKIRKIIELVAEHVDTELIASMVTGAHSEGRKRRKGFRGFFGRLLGKG